MSAKTVLLYTSKPYTMRWGGDDSFLLELVNAWPSAEDQLRVVINEGHPCRDIFEKQLPGRVKLLILPEELLIEKRARIAKKYTRPFLRSVIEFGIDALRPIRLLGALKRLRAFLNQVRPDVLLVISGGNPPNDVTWRLLVAARICRVPKVILSLHSLPGKGTNWLRSLGISLLRRLTPVLCDDIVALTETTSRILSDSMGTRRKFICIPNGIDPSKGQDLSLDEKRKRLELRDGTHIGAIGNLMEGKGFAYLIRAMIPLLQQHPNIDLTIIGGDVEGYEKHLRSLIQELHLEQKVRLAGYLPHAATFCECFDICVVPSSSFECLPFAAIEAMRYKKPVVATTMGGLPDVVEDQKTGILVPPADSDALARALAKLLGLPDLCKQMGEKAYERFSRQFTSSIMAKRYYEVAHS
jgi:glycosyltransferase involved in cell wall biosynthesis